MIQTPTAPRDSSAELYEGPGLSPRHTEYRVRYVRNHWCPFELRGRNPRTDRWEPLFSESEGFIRQWLIAADIDPDSIRWTRLGGAPS